MNTNDQDLPDPELIAALRADFVPVSAAVKEHVSSRLTQSVGALAIRRAGAAATPGPKGSLLAAFRAHPTGFIAVFGTGALLGAGVHAATRRAESAPIVYVARVTTASSAATLSAPVPAAPSPAALTNAQAVPAPSNVMLAPTASVGRNGLAGLAEQQALLDVARSAFARSDYAATLATLKAHFRRYPTSVLGEEREALEIKTLAATGHAEEAKARAARFKTQFPQSLLLPSLSDSLQAIP
jgi:hypothetical protein